MNSLCVFQGTHNLSLHKQSTVHTHMKAQAPGLELHCKGNASSSPMLGAILAEAKVALHTAVLADAPAEAAASLPAAHKAKRWNTHLQRSHCHSNTSQPVRVSTKQCKTLSDTLQTLCKSMHGPALLQHCCSAARPEITRMTAILQRQWPAKYDKAQCITSLNTHNTTPDAICRQENSKLIESKSSRGAQLLAHDSVQ